MLPILFLVALNSMAQTKKQEVSIAVGGGFSSLDYKVEQGYMNYGAGLQAELAYALYLGPNWSLGLGLAYQRYNTRSYTGTVSGAYATEDFEGESFEFRYTAKHHQELQSLDYLNIPLKVQYETKGTKTFFVSAGAMLGVPVRGAYQSGASAINTSGYYSQYNAELTEPVFAGFGKYGIQIPESRELGANISYSAILETGLKHQLKGNSSMYIGLFLNYGLNTIITPQSKELIMYHAENPAQFVYNNIFDAEMAKDVRLVAYGLKLKYSLGF